MTNREKRKKINQIKLDAGCVFCGYDRHPGGLVFHHRNPKDKKFKISRSMCRSWEKFQLEITKCEVMCSNCHTLYHRLQEACT